MSGKQGEQLFQKRALEKGYSVKDVSSDPEYWYKDIDFFITSPTSGLTKSFEVKYDSIINRTGNLYIELTNVHSRQGKGWFQFCEAELLAYGDAAQGIFYIIPLDQLRQRIEQLPKRYTRCGNDSTGLLVSLSDIQDLIRVF